MTPEEEKEMLLLKQKQLRLREQRAAQQQEVQEEEPDMTGELLGITEDLVQEETPTIREARERARPSRIAKDLGRAVGRGALEGLSLNQAERIESLIRRSMSAKDYQDILKQVRKEYGEDRAEFPGTFMLGEVGGGVILPGGAALKGIRKLKQLFGKGGKFAPKTGKLGTAAEAAKQAAADEAISITDTEGSAEDILLSALNIGASSGLGLALSQKAPLSTKDASRVQKEMLMSASAFAGLPPSAKRQLRASGIDSDTIARRAVADDMIDAGLESPVEYLDLLQTKLRNAGNSIDRFSKKIANVDMDTEGVVRNAFDNVRENLRAASTKGEVLKFNTTKSRLDENKIRLENLKNSIEKSYEEGKAPSKALLARAQTLNAKVKEGQYRLDIIEEYGDLNVPRLEMLERLEKEAPTGRNITDLIKYRQDVGDMVKKWTAGSTLADDTKDTLARDLTLELTDAIDDEIGRTLGGNAAKEYQRLRTGWREALVLAQGLGTYKGMEDKVFKAVDSVLEDSRRFPFLADSIYILGDPMHRGRAAIRAGARMIKGEKPTEFTKRIEGIERKRQLLKQGKKPKGVMDSPETVVKTIRTLGSALDAATSDKKEDTRSLMNKLKKDK